MSINHPAKVSRKSADTVRGAVVEVLAEDPLAARRLIEHLPEVQSITQLGTRLRALVERRAGEDPAAGLRARLAAEGLAAELECVPASLEDVFVAATRRGPADAPAEAAA